MPSDLIKPQRFYPPPLHHARTSRVSSALPIPFAQVSPGKYTVIYPPTIDYDYMKQRPQHLMDQFAADGHRVYYLNRWERPAPPQEVRPNLFVVHSAGHIDHLPRSRPVVLWMSWAETSNWIDRIRPDISIYDCLDDFPQFAPAEWQIVPRVNLVTATSDALFRKMRDQHRNVILVPNACEYERFSDLSSVEAPPDWPPIDPNQSVVGYVGALGAWIDSDLIARIGERYEMVLVGPLLGHRRIQHPRIHYLGMRPYEQLPAYLKRMDVLTIPFSDIPLTRATNPIKMYEYLATGKPVVSTAIPEAERMALVKVGHSHEEFVQHIARAIAGEDENEAAAAARQTIARENSWALRYEQIRDAIDAVWQEKNRR